MLRTQSVNRDVILALLSPPGMSLVDSTAAIQRALDRGGVVTLPPTGGPWPVSNFTMDVENTELHLNGATLVAVAGSTGTMISMNAENCRIIGPGTIDFRLGNYSVGITVATSDCKLWDFDTQGNLFNPRLPNAANPTPARHINIRAAGDADILSGVSVRGLTVTGGTNGVCWAGARDSECFDCTAYYQSPGLGFMFDYAGFPSVNTKWRNLEAVGSGYYGLSCTNLATTSVSAGWGIPVQGMHLTDIRARHCAWASLFGTTSQLVGTQKLGMDWTTSYMTRGHLEAEFYNNAGGSLEIKRLSDVAGVVSETNAFNSLYARIKGWHAMDLGDGISPVNGDLTESSTNFSNVIVDADLWYVGCPPWAAGLRQEVWSPVSSNGYNWVTVSQEPGVAGPTAPTGGGFKSTTTSGTTSVGASSLVVSSATGIAIGQTIFVSGAGTQYLADGATVTNVVGTTISLSSNVLVQIPSGKSIIFAQEHYDGALWWRTVEATPATASAPTNCIGVNSQGSRGLIVRGSVTNFKFGAQMNAYASSDNAVLDCAFQNWRVRGVDVVCQMQSSKNDGTGICQIDMFNCDMEATGPAASVRQGIVITNRMTSRFRMFGGRLSAPGDSSIAIRQNDTGADVNCTIELHGGAVIDAPTPFFLTTNATPANTVYAIDLDNCTIIGSHASNSPVTFDGSGTAKFGPACRISSNATAGWKAASGSTITVTGSPLRTSRTTAPTSSTPGNIGERILLATPTMGVYGYFNTASDFGGGAYTWEALSLGAPSSLRRASAAVNFNSANTDTTIAMVLGTGYTRYIVREVWLSGFSATGTTATCGLFTAAAAGGTAIVSSGTAITVSTASEGSANNSQLLTIATGATQSFTGASVFFRVQTAQGSACTGNVTVVYEPLS